MLGSLLRTPPAPLLLGLAGVGPFAAAAAGVFVFGGDEVDGRAQLSLALLVLWGGLVLAFLGGTRWGRALGPEFPPPGAVTLMSAVFPSIIAWVAVAVALPPVSQPVLGISILIGGFVHMLLWDLKGVRQGLWPDWYQALRIVLTLGAAMALIAGAVGAALHGL